MKFGFWQLMVLKDDVICSAMNLAVKIRSTFKLSEQRLIARNPVPAPSNRDEDVFIVLNGPSISRQDLSVLVGKTVIFVNRGFSHPLFLAIQPKYHVFVDPKMLTGEWPITWFDEILAMVPDITFVMPAAWARNEKFKKYLDAGVSFHWLQHAAPFECIGVAGCCFDFAAQQQYKSIYFTGFDATGLPNELIGSSSHFYGVNSENLKKTTENYVVDLLMFSRHLHDLRKLAKRFERKRIPIFNLTEGGLLDMFPRKNISQI